MSSNENLDLATIAEEPKNVELLSDIQLDPSTKQWYSSFTFKVNDPIILNVSADKREINIYNYFMLSVSGVILSIFDGKDDMPIYQFDKFEPLHHYRLSIPVERFASISETLTFDKIQFRLINLGPDYDILKKIDVCWKINIPKNQYMNLAKWGPVYNGRANTRKDVERLLVNITNLAYVLSSKEFEIILDHYKEVTGRTFDKFPWRTDKNNKDGSITYVNQDEKKRCWDMTDEKQKKEFFNLLGVRNSTYGVKQKRNSFTLDVMDANSKLVGKGQCLSYIGWGTDFISEGFAWYPRAAYNRVTKNRITHYCWVHDMGHMFGFMHYSAFSVGPLAEQDPSVVQTLGALQAPDMPYYSLMENESMTRCGYNKMEIWMYNHSDLFDPKFKERIEKDNASRNALVDKCKQTLDQYNQVPAVLRGLFAKTYNITGFLCDYDKDIYEMYGNMNQFNKLTISK